MYSFNENIIIYFTTYDPNTGKSTNADSLPSYSIYLNNSLHKTGSAINQFNGVYYTQFSSSVNDGFITGNYSVFSHVTMSGVNVTALISNFYLRSQSIDYVSNYNGITQNNIESIATSSQQYISNIHGNGSYSTVSLNTQLSSSLANINNNTFNSLQVLKGKWEITAANKLIMYQEDGSTTLYEFNLYDINGIPTTSSVAMRSPV